jgi:ankyrin repeat protein
MATAIVKEARENSKTRTLAKRLSNKMSHSQKLAAKIRILDLCSTYDHATTWKQIRKVGNASWFRQDAHYQNWKSQICSSTLVFRGKLGSGKSVVMANIVEDLNVFPQYQGKNIPVSYFFCRYDIAESLKERTVIGSLARQLLHTSFDLDAAVGILEKADMSLVSSEVIDILRQALPSDHKAFFVLDGLDECDPDQRKALAFQLRVLQKLFTLHVCISFRGEPNGVLNLGSTQLASTSIMSIPEDNPDIEAFIKADLESCLESGKLEIGDHQLILEIQDALWKGSQGMFLWVALQIQSLCSMETDQAIRDALADLPEDLSETFTRILRKSRLGKSGLYQTRILQFVAVAFRLLTTDELREALSVVPGNTEWNPSQLLNNVYSALASCGCLVVVDEEELTVRFVHHSVQQFLLNGYVDATNSAFTMDMAHLTMANTIVTYLNYDVLDTQLATTVQVPELAAATLPSKVIYSTLSHSPGVKDLAVRLLKSRKQTTMDVCRSLAKAQKPFQLRSIEKFHFHSYAKSYWLQHIKSFSCKDMLVYDLIRRLLEGRTTNTIASNEICQELLWSTVSNGYDEAVKLLLESGKIIPDPGILQYAATLGHEDAMRVLLASGMFEVDAKDKQGNTALLQATLNGHAAVVKLLLATDGVNVDSKDFEGKRPLTWAACKGHIEIAKLLLEKSKENVDWGDNEGKSPLLWAAERGHEEMVKLLLTIGEANPDYKGQHGETPWSLAAKMGHEAIVKLLLDTGKVDVNSKNVDSRTPLLLASEYGLKGIVKLLLDTGKVDVNLEDVFSRTPLSVASGHGCTEIVELLLDTGKVDVNSKDVDSRTPLLVASEYEHTEIVKLLLDTGKVDINLKDVSSRTPLSVASEHRYTEIVKLLLDTGKVDINSKDVYSRTPLSVAVENGYTEIVKLLLETDGVDISLGPPLTKATAKRHPGIVKLLRNYGAKE